MSKITPIDLLELFDNGIVIHAAWIMPGSHWEYSVQRVGQTTCSKSIATRSTLSAAYNAAQRYLRTKYPEVGETK